MSIEAMRQALEALEAVRHTGDIIAVQTQANTVSIDDAITGIRSAIAEAEKQEPVAWVDEMAEVPDHVWEPPFRFRRFVAGRERAQDVVIERETTIEAAAKKAAKICPPEPMTVLVYTTPPAAYPEFECPRCGHYCARGQE